MKSTELGGMPRYDNAATRAYAMIAHADAVRDAVIDGTDDELDVVADAMDAANTACDDAGIRRVFDDVDIP